MLNGDVAPACLSLRWRRARQRHFTDPDFPAFSCFRIWKAVLPSRSADPVPPSAEMIGRQYRAEGGPASDRGMGTWHQ